MGRYRPPQPQGSKYITPQGFARLSEELDYLWKIKRPEVTKALSEAAAEGDRSENAEYIYRKKQLREIDSRVRFLRKRLENMKVIETKPGNTSQVFFGAWITLEDENGTELTYRIVGPDEFDVDPKFISMDSPLAKALLGKAKNSDVFVNTPSGQKEYYIVEVKYE